MWPCRHACRCVHFYPRPPRGGRPGAGRQSWLQGYFYPRPPRGGRHIADIEKTPEPIFLSTPSARRATAGGPVYGAYYDNFYPRPPRGGRPCPVPSSLSMTMISIHALREEGDHDHRSEFHQRFCISIHALREEGDRRWSGRGSGIDYFYPRPPRGGRPDIRTELDPAGKFLSTPSARRATRTASSRCRG